jgi:hypothetical protein
VGLPGAAKQFKLAGVIPHHRNCRRHQILCRVETETGPNDCEIAGFANFT